MRLWKYLRHYFVPGTHNAQRPRILHRPWLIFFLAAVLAAEGFLVSNLVARQSDQQFLAAVVPAEVIALTNTERADNDVGPLTEDDLLQQAAQAKADDMAAKDYFSHVGPDGKTPWQWISEAGYQYQYAGENLAVRFIDSSDVVNAWMASPTHRANIVKPVYTEIGVGVAQGLYQGESATYIVQYFGTPKSADAAAVAITAPPPAAPSTSLAASTTPAALPSAQPKTSLASTQVSTTSPARVEGAATEASAPAAASTDITAPPTITKSASLSDSVVRQVVRAFSEPEQSADIFLGLIGALLLLALLITFFVHVQVQHPAMLLSGAFVAFLAFFFLILNVHLVGGLSDTGQSAGVINAAGGVVISAEAADTGYALFPH